MQAVTEQGGKETRKERLAWARRAGLGRTSAVGVVAGVLVAYAAFALLVGVATAVVAALGVDVDLTDREWERLGAGAGIAAGVLLFVAYLFGGYVSGRMARRAGMTNGLFVFLGALIVAGATVATVEAAGGSDSAMERLRAGLDNFGVPTSGSQWGDVGTVAGIAALTGMLFGALFGGVLGERWHAKVTRANLAAPAVIEASAEDQPDSPAGDERVGVLEERVEELEERVEDQEGREPATVDLEQRVEELERREPAMAVSAGRGADNDHSEPTKADLYRRAQEAEIEGRSHMNKDELAEALSDQES